MIEIEMKDVETGDILVFNSGRLAKVKQIMLGDNRDFLKYYVIPEQGEAFWISENGLLSMDKDTDFVRSIACNDEDEPAEHTLEGLLDTSDLPAGMKWADKMKIKKDTQNLFDLIRPYKRDFSISELAVLYWRANNKIMSRTAMTQNCVHWTNNGYMERTGQGRYRLK